MAFWRNYHNRFKFLLLFILCIQIYNAIQYRQHKVTNFGCEICADKAGYYIYLPIWFNYGIDTANMPELVRSRTNERYQNDLAPGKSFTKFSAGVAMMLSPFYAVGNFRHQVFGSVHPIPISVDYLEYVNFGTAVYLTLAFLCLFLLLRKRFGDGPALITLVLLYFGTSLRYYTEDESLMSHVYSFCQFAYAWFFFEKALLLRKRVWLILFAICASWAVLIRPTNIFGILLILFMGMSRTNWKEEFLYLSKSIVWMLVPAFLIWIPQFAYWKITTGNWLVYSYQEEGFHRWKHPELGEQWFAVQSGVLTYTPAFILIPIGIIGMYWQKGKAYAPLLASFIFMTLLLASWWAKGFGDCNFGYRSFVEFTALWSPAIAWLAAQVLKSKTSVQVMSLAFVLVSFWYTNHLYWQFHSCFFGQPWEYGKFISDYFS